MTDRSDDGPTITIVTACYNSVPFLARIHRSLKRQTYRKFEWICVDDCSTDDTVAELLKLDSPGDLGMEVYRLPLNSGGPLALAVGTQRSSGEVTIWLDHDDELFDFALAEVARTWPTVRDDDEVAGITFRALSPSTGRLVGRDLPPGLRMSASEALNRYPDVSDGTIAVKTELMKAFATPLAMESLVLNGPHYLRLTAVRTLAIADAPPVRYYHRDNPQSQTLSERLSRKTVSSYAQMLDLADRHFLRRPWLWLRHAATLLRYSKAVHGRWYAGLSEIERAPIRLLVASTLPLALLAGLRKLNVRLIIYPAADLVALADLPNLRSSK